jgi:hypothetical protein
MNAMRPAPLHWLHGGAVLDPMTVRWRSASRRSSQAGQLYPLPCSDGAGIDHFPLVLAVLAAHASDASVHYSLAFGHKVIQPAFATFDAHLQLG